MIEVEEVEVAVVAVDYGSGVNRANSTAQNSTSKLTSSKSLSVFMIILFIKIVL